MGAGGRIDPSQVLVADLSELRWERESAVRGVGPVAHDKLGSFVRRKLKKVSNKSQRPAFSGIYHQLCSYNLSFSGTLRAFQRRHGPRFVAFVLRVHA